MIRPDIIPLSYKNRLSDMDYTIAMLNSHIKNGETKEINETLADLLEQITSFRKAIIEAEPYKSAMQQYNELKEYLTKVGTFSKTDRSDFVSHVWKLSLGDPRANEDDPNFSYIDFEYKDITATLFWSSHKKNPELSPFIDIWLEGYEEPLESFNAEDGEF